MSRCSSAASTSSTTPARAARRIGYGENFRPHDKAWIDAIAQNMDVGQFTQRAVYKPERRAIATDNLMVRELPTMDPSFYDHHLAGEGYPFDNLQISAVRPGTPLYVLGSSVDGGWRYVQTPDVQGWVRSDGVGLTDDTLRRHVARRHREVAGRGDSRVGAGARQPRRVPLRRARRHAAAARSAQRHAARGNAANQAASGNCRRRPPRAKSSSRPAMWTARRIIRTAQLSDAQIAPMPLAATPRHLAMLMKTLIGRPYGWGNSGLYNDCSSELQSIFAAFGVWLPRHSSTQMSAGQHDRSVRVDARRNGSTIWPSTVSRCARSIYIGGHVMLYIGNTTRNGSRGAGRLSGRVGLAARRQQPARGDRRLGDPAAVRAHSRRCARCNRWRPRRRSRSASSARRAAARRRPPPRHPMRTTRRVEAAPGRNAAG